MSVSIRHSAPLASARGMSSTDFVLLLGVLGLLVFGILKIFGGGEKKAPLLAASAVATPAIPAESPTPSVPAEPVFPTISAPAPVFPTVTPSATLPPASPASAIPPAGASGTTPSGAGTPGSIITPPHPVSGELPRRAR